MKASNEEKNSYQAAVEMWQVSVASDEESLAQANAAVAKNCKATQTAAAPPVGPSAAPTAFDTSSEPATTPPPIAVTTAPPPAPTASTPAPPDCTQQGNACMAAQASYAKAAHMIFNWNGAYDLPLPCVAGYSASLQTALTTPEQQQLLNQWANARDAYLACSRGISNPTPPLGQPTDIGQPGQQTAGQSGQQAPSGLSAALTAMVPSPMGVPNVQPAPQSAPVSTSADSSSVCTTPTFLCSYSDAKGTVMVSKAPSNANCPAPCLASDGSIASFIGPNSPTTDTPLPQGGCPNGQRLGYLYNVATTPYGCLCSGGRGWVAYGQSCSNVNSSASANPAMAPIVPPPTYTPTPMPSMNNPAAPPGGTTTAMPPLPQPTANAATPATTPTASSPTPGTGTQTAMTSTTSATNSGGCSTVGGLTTCTQASCPGGVNCTCTTTGSYCTPQPPSVTSSATTPTAPGQPANTTATPQNTGPLQMKPTSGTGTQLASAGSSSPSQVQACASNPPFLPWGGTGSATITVSGGQPCGIGWHDTGATILDSMSVTSPPSHGSLKPQDQHVIIFTPAPGYKGQDSFTLTMQEHNGGRSATLRVNVSVTIQ